MKAFLIKFSKYFGIALLVVLLLLGALRLPFIQTFITQKVMAGLSERLNTTMSVDKVNINFIDQAVLKNIYLEDQHQDTLLFASSIKIDLAFFALFKKEIKLDKVELSNALVNIEQMADSSFNFSFIPAAFASSDTSQKSSPFNFSLGEVHLENVRGNIDLLSNQHDIDIGMLQLVINSIDFETLSFDIEKIHLAQAKVKNCFVDSENTTQAETTEAEETIPFPFENLPVAVKCKRLKLEEVDYQFQQGNGELSASFSPKFIALDNTNIAIENILLQSEELSFDMRPSTFTLNEQYLASELNLTTFWTPDSLYALSSPWSFNKSQLDWNLSASYQSFDDLLQISPKTQIAFEAEDLHIWMNDLFYFVPALATNEYFTKLEGEWIKLSAGLQGNLGDLSIDSFELGTLDSKIALKGGLGLSMDWRKLKFNKLSTELSSPVKDLRQAFGEQLVTAQYRRFGNIELNTEISGSIQNLAIHKFFLDTEGSLQASLTGNVKDLDQIDQLSFALDLEKLNTSYHDLQALTGDLPKLLSKVKTLSYKGKLKGDLNTFNLNGNFYSNLGEISADLFADFNQNYSYASYQGSLTLDQFKLGELLSTDSLGTISLQAEIDGAGLSIDTLHAKTTINISQFDFNSYSYQNILVDGRIDEKQFEGDLVINDEHLDFTFNGLVNLTDSVPAFKFTADLKNLDAQALNLTSIPLHSSLKIESNLTGNNLNDLDGDLRITELILDNETNDWKEDSIVLHIENKTGLKRDVHLASSFMNLDLTGKYSLPDIPKLILAYAEQFFPISTLTKKSALSLANPDSVVSVIQNEVIEVHLRLTQLEKIAQVFKIELKRMDSVRLDFVLDGPGETLDLQFFIPQIHYQNIYADSIYLSAQSNGETLESSVKIDSIGYAELFYIPGFELSSNFKEQKALLRTIIEGDTGSHSLDVKVQIASAGGAFTAEFLSPTILNSQVWNVKQEQKFALYQDSLFLPSITLFKGAQEFEFLARENLLLTFQNFGLNNIAELVQMDSMRLNGKINGTLSFNEVEDGMSLLGDLAIENIRVNQNDVGNLNLQASQSGDLVNAEITLDGLDNDIRVQANYNLNTKYLDGQVNLNKLVLSNFEPFVANYVSNLEGSMQGQVEVSGSIEEPVFDGRASFQLVKAKVLALGTTYGIKSGFVQLNETRITPSIILSDEENRKASLTGSIDHDLFTDFKFNLNLQTDKFTFLNSQKDFDALFYGKLVGGLILSVKGDLAQPILSGKVDVQKESDITVQLLSQKAVASQESYVVFVNGSSYNETNMDSLVLERYEVNSKVDIDLDITINEKTRLNLVIDPLTGDKLALQGSGRLGLRIPPRGDMNVSGTYTVSQGQYNFSFQKLLKRKFEIVEGSQIVFSGNPILAQLDIQAAYNTQASVYGLVSDQAATLSEEEQRNLKKKEEVRILLNIEGKLSEPELNFDIRLPSEGNSPLGNSAKRALEQIKVNESELNKQVFSLLLFNNFTGSSSSGNISSTGTSTAIRSVGNLLNNQLNKLASKAEGFEIDFNLDQYQNQFSQGNEQITEVDLGVSQSLLNDRLILSVGGNVDFESGQKEEGVLGNLAGDFVLEYKLSENGKYRVKVFQKSDYDALNDANLWKTGAGFSYESKFGKVLKNKGSKK